MKKMLVIAVAAGLAAPAMVMADTTLYGKLSAELVSTKNAAGDNFTDVQDNGSRIGIKGSVALDNGMEAVYLIEDTLNVTETQAALGAGARQKGVGLKGGFGTVMVGHLYGPTKLSSSKVDMFVDQLGDYNSAGALGSTNDLNTVENAVPDAIAYLNKFGPVSVAIAASSDPVNGAPATDGTTSAVDAMAAYDNNGVYVALGHQNVEGVGRDTTRLTGAYSFPAGHQVGVVLENAKQSDDTTDKAVVLSGGYKMGNGMLKAQVGERKDKSADTKGKLAAIGYDYNLSKSTKVMVEYAKGTDATINAANAVEKGFGVGLSTSF